MLDTLASVVFLKGGLNVAPCSCLRCIDRCRSTIVCKRRYFTPPGGVYRLKPGIYVSSGTDCGSPPNAAILTYDGKGLSDPHSHACRARVLSREGDRYTVVQSCVDVGAGATPRRLERQKITVSDALTCRQTINGRTTGHRFCPASMLPRDLQKITR